MGLEENEKTRIILGGCYDETSSLFFQTVIFLLWEKTIYKPPRYDPN